jgi:hypothetical protein
MAGVSLAIAGTASRPLLADSVAISIHSPQIAESLNALAQERPEVAAVLDRLLAIGPYGLVLSSVLPLVLQLLTNHNILPARVAAPLGCKSPDDLIKLIVSETQDVTDSL